MRVLPGRIGSTPNGRTARKGGSGGIPDPPIHPEIGGCLHGVCNLVRFPDKIVYIRSEDFCTRVRVGRSPGTGQ